MPTQSEIVSTLERMSGVTNVRSCTLVIGGVPYAGARYLYTGKTPRGSKARLAGRGTYREERFYVLGEVPEHDRVSFVLDGEQFEWFVAGWATQQTVSDARYQAFHPLGEWFGLHAWDVADKIDAYEDEDRKYERVKVQVIYADV